MSPARVTCPDPGPWPPCPPWCEDNHAFESASAVQRVHRYAVPWEMPPMAFVGETRSFTMTLVRLDLFANGARTAGGISVQIYPGLGARVRQAAEAGLADDRVQMLRLDSAGTAALAWLLGSVDDWSEVRSLTRSLLAAVRMAHAKEGTPQ